jgi:alpha-ribazole phosphatase/probable phosphoglycerate mutase
MPRCPAPDTCRLYLLRHGATELNCADPPRLQGRRCDLPLSKEGVDQAQAAGRRLAGEPLAAVYSSPLLRARQTAEAVAAPHGLTICPVAELIEVDVGRWEGRSWDEIARNDAEAYRLFTLDASIHPYSGGENMAMVLDRVRPALDGLMAGNLGRLVAVAAHNVVNRVYLAHLLGVPLARYREIVQDNGAISLIEYRGGRAEVLWINSISHLEKEEG